MHSRLLLAVLCLCGLFISSPGFAQDKLQAIFARYDQEWTALQKKYDAAWTQLQQQNDAEWRPLSQSGSDEQRAAYHRRVDARVASYHTARDAAIAAYHRSRDAAIAEYHAKQDADVAAIARMEEENRRRVEQSQREREQEAIRKRDEQAQRERAHAQQLSAQREAEEAAAQRRRADMQEKQRLAQERVRLEEAARQQLQQDRERRAEQLRRDAEERAWGERKKAIVSVLTMISYGVMAFLAFYFGRRAFIWLHYVLLSHPADHLLRDKVNKSIDVPAVVDRIAASLQAPSDWKFIDHNHARVARVRAAELQAETAVYRRRADELHAKLITRMKFEGDLKSAVEGAQAAQWNEKAARMLIAKLASVYGMKVDAAF